MSEIFRKTAKEVGEDHIYNDISATNTTNNNNTADGTNQIIKYFAEESISPTRKLRSSNINIDYVENTSPNLTETDKLKDDCQNNPNIKKSLPKIRSSNEKNVNILTKNLPSYKRNHIKSVNRSQKDKSTKIQKDKQPTNLKTRAINKVKQSKKSFHFIDGILIGAFLGSLGATIIGGQHA